MKFLMYKFMLTSSLNIQKRRGLKLRRTKEIQLLSGKYCKIFIKRDIM